MKSRQFPSFNEALSYLESRGKLQYFGRVGSHYEYCSYTLIIGHTRYHLLISDDGLVMVRDTTYV